MKKTIFVTIFAMFTTVGFAQDAMKDLNAHLLKIKSQTNAGTIGIVYNPTNVNIEGSRVSVKTMALPAKTGPVLIQNVRAIVKKVDALYLIKGQIVTTPKLAKFIVKNAQKSDVKVFTNDQGLAGVEGIHLISADGDGNISVKVNAD